MAHPNCQQKLVEIWYTGVLRQLSKTNQFVVALLALALLPLIPLLCAAHILAPRSRAARLLTQQPCVKFVAHLAAYLLFILMILVSSTTCQLQLAARTRTLSAFLGAPLFAHYAACLRRSPHFAPNYADFYLRDSTPTEIDILITIWLFGKLYKCIAGS